MRVKKIENGLICGCIVLLFLFMLSIVMVTFTRQILVKQLRIHNAFTDFIVMDNAASNNANGTESGIEWAQLYPFESEDVSIKSNSSRNILALNRIRIEDIKRKIDYYCSDALLGYQSFVEQARAYDKFIAWNFASYEEYNGVIKMPDGHFTVYTWEKDVNEHANALIELARFCEEREKHFLYIQAPNKVCEYEDKQISGSLDFSNQNANRLIDILENSNIDVFDVRDSLHDEGYIHHEMFYRTDHHWLTTTGLWAAKNTLDYCNVKYGFSADTQKLELSMFDQKVYSDWFLGSCGKKVTLSQAEPDDFILLYPKYETVLHYYVPAENIEIAGDYSIVYDMKQIDEKDYYNKNPYAGCNYGDQPLIQIRNMLEADNNKILIIHDSFGDSFISCLALCEAEVDSLDMRHFTGSVKNYINATDPDIVMVMYRAGAAGGKIDWTTHLDEFDFR